MNSKNKKSKNDMDWAKAKKLCRLNQDDIRMAKELGFKPKSLMKNNPNQSQQWKAPVKVWIRDLYFERFGKILGNNSNHTKNQSTKPDHDIPEEQEYADEQFYLNEPIQDFEELPDRPFNDDDELPF